MTVTSDMSIDRPEIVLIEESKDDFIGSDLDKKSQAAIDSYISYKQETEENTTGAFEAQNIIHVSQCEPASSETSPVKNGNS